MLTKEQYETLLPHKPTIKHVAHGGNTSKSDAWWAMCGVHLQRVGEHLKSGCPPCMVEDYQRYWNLMMEYEASIFNLTNNN